MFSNALSKQIEYPPNLVSKELASLLSMMLNKDQTKRITKGQTHKIKSHPWLKSVNWSDVINKKYKPPFQPSVSHSNFDPEFERESSIKQNRVRATPLSSVCSFHFDNHKSKHKVTLQKFHNFYYTSLQPAPNPIKKQPCKKKVLTSIKKPLASFRTKVSPRRSDSSCEISVASEHSRRANSPVTRKYLNTPMLRIQSPIFRKHQGCTSQTRENKMNIERVMKEYNSMSSLQTVTKSRLQFRPKSIERISTKHTNIASYSSIKKRAAFELRAASSQQSSITRSQLSFQRVIVASNTVLQLTKLAKVTSPKTNSQKSSLSRDSKLQPTGIPSAEYYKRICIKKP